MYTVVSKYKTDRLVLRYKELQSDTEWLCVLLHVCTDRLASLDLFVYTHNFKRFRQEIRDMCIEQTDSEPVHDIFGVLTIPPYIQSCIMCIVWARGKQFQTRD